MCACVQEMAQSQRESIKESFKDVKFFCATSDIWSRSNKSFIAVTVHYFDPKTLELRSKFIACEFFPGRHTHDRVASKLNSIFDRFDILNRVYFITTDGAGEYTAAFKHFGDNYKSIHLQNANDDNLDWLNRAPSGGDDDDDSNRNANEDSSDSESESENDPDSFVRTLSEAESNANGKSTEHADPDPETFHIHELPPLPLLAHMNRVDCSAHKLEKLGKVDADLAKGHDAVYDGYHDRVFTKLEKIWNLKHSRLSAELFTRLTDKKLIGPHRIRWLKTYEAVSVFFLYIFFN